MTRDEEIAALRQQLRELETTLQRIIAERHTLQTQILMASAKEAGEALAPSPASGPPDN